MLISIKKSDPFDIELERTNREAERLVGLIHPTRLQLEALIGLLLGDGSIHKEKRDFGWNRLV